jgi:Domain of unknown function (DUF4288)
MSWYIAKIIFRITSDTFSQKPQFDEHIRLISAANFEEAFRKSRMLGIKEEDIFLRDTTKVKWEFVNVAELYPLKELSDGTELYSQINEAEEANAYIYHVHQKAAFMQIKDRPVF